MSASSMVVAWWRDAGTWRSETGDTAPIPTAAPLVSARKSSCRLGSSASLSRPFCPDRPPIVFSSAGSGRRSSAMETWLGPSFKQLVRPSRHDEVVSVQSTDLMGPPGDRYPAPFGQQRGVVPLFLGLLAHTVGESKCLGKVTEPEHALQALDAFTLSYLPLGDLRVHLGDFGVG